MRATARRIFPIADAPFTSLHTKKHRKQHAYLSILMNVIHTEIYRALSVFCNTTSSSESDDRHIFYHFRLLVCSVAQSTNTQKHIFLWKLRSDQDALPFYCIPFSEPLATCLQKLLNNNGPKAHDDKENTEECYEERPIDPIIKLTKTNLHCSSPNTRREMLLSMVVPPVTRYRLRRQGTFSLTWFRQIQISRNDDVFCLCGIAFYCAHHALHLTEKTQCLSRALAPTVVLRRLEPTTESIQNMELSIYLKQNATFTSARIRRCLHLAPSYSPINFSVDNRTYSPVPDIGDLLNQVAYPQVRQFSASLFYTRRPPEGAKSNVLRTRRVHLLRFHSADTRRRFTCNSTSLIGIANCPRSFPGLRTQPGFEFRMWHTLLPIFCNQNRNRSCTSNGSLYVS